MFSIEVNTADLKKIAKDFGSNYVQETLDNSVKKSVILLNRNAIMEAPTDRWRLRNSFQTEFRSLFWRLFNPVEYAVYVQEWTRPHSAPFDVIAERARRKGLNAGAVWRSIKKKGTKANPFMTRAIENSDSEIDKIFQEEIDRLVLRFNQK